MLAGGLAAGALVFFAGGVALAIVPGTVLDGIPESVVIGAGLTQGAAVVAAVF